MLSNITAIGTSLMVDGAGPAFINDNLNYMKMEWNGNSALRKILCHDWLPVIKLYLSNKSIKYVTKHDFFKSEDAKKMKK